jgi:hypothetical protein
MTKPVAKSLHTVTVIVQVARRVLDTSGYSTDEALDIAMDCLGLADRPDPYGLAAAARKQLDKGTP